ncbi:MAG TPA: hypothetical protein VH744_05710, partial [Terriglobales bacterium]
MARFGWVITAMLLGTSLSLAETGALASMPARLAIYYGYPSLVNGARGDVEKAAAAFSAYDVVVLGDGLEFADKQPGRRPVGDPAEHQKTLQIIAAARRRNPSIRFYGYVPLGDNHSLRAEEIEERSRLWKQMGVAGIFLDEASYDFKIVTRERQNRAVGYVHQLGLSVFMNGYFLDHLFSLEDKMANENGTGKNPKHLPPLLDHRDLFLMESFQVSNGTFEDPSHWQARMKQASAYRSRYGTRIFAITTTTEPQGFDAQKFNYAWWSAWLYDVDGFGWGEPNFSAANNMLPDRSCRSGVAGRASAAN